jgi:hypothetical protein
MAKSLFIILLALSIIKLFNCFGENDEQTMKHISVLACAALAKKMTEVPTELKKFDKLVELFAERIQYEPEQTRNFVNLLILNNCFKSLSFDDAGVIIKERAETKSVSASHLKYLDLDNCYESYTKLDNDQKKELFQELAEIKELLKGLSESLGDITKGDYGKIAKEAMKGKSSSETTDKKASSSSSTSKTKNSESKSNSTEEEVSMFGFFFQFIYVTFIGVSNLISDNSYIFVIAIVLAVLFSLLSKKRLKKKVKKEKINN